jgi:hypothetical protein
VRPPCWDSLALSGRVISLTAAGWRVLPSATSFSLSFHRRRFGAVTVGAVFNVAR